MEVGTAEAEGADRSTARCVSAGQPGAFFSCQVERSAAGGNFIQRFFDLDGGRQDFVMQCQGGLDHAGCSGGSFGVTDLGFDRAERTPGCVGFAVDIA